MVLLLICLATKKTSANNNKIFSWREETKDFSCVYKKSYFALPKNVRLNSADSFIIKTPNK